MYISTYAHTYIYNAYTYGYMIIELYQYMYTPLYIPKYSQVCTRIADGDSRACVCVHANTQIYIYFFIHMYI